MADPPSLDSLLQGVSRNNLITECSNEHLIKIAKWFKHWKDISADLGLTDAEEEVIESLVGDLNRKKLDMLRKWKSKYTTKANYLKLAEVFHDNDKNDLVTKLCDLISSVPVEDGDEKQEKAHHVKENSPPRVQHEAGIENKDRTHIEVSSTNDDQTTAVHDHGDTESLPSNVIASNEKPDVQVGTSSVQNEVTMKGKGGTESEMTSQNSNAVLSVKSNVIQTNCGCGDCNFEILISNGCPKRLRAPFTYLDTSSLNQKQKDILLLKLSEDADAIFNQWDNIVDQFSSWMELNVSLQVYKDILSSISGRTSAGKDMPMLSNRKQEIGAAKSHLECSAILSDYHSWFNCSILGTVISKASQRDVSTFHSSLQSYMDELHKYCKRYIFECPPLSSISSTTSKTYLVLKVTEEQLSSIERVSAEKIMLFTAKLMQPFEIEDYVLHLHTVGVGCVELVYSIPLCIYNELFPLNEDQCKSLPMLGVIEVITKDYHYKKDSVITGAILQQVHPYLKEARRLILAARNGDIATVKRLLAEGNVDVNVTDENNTTPLYWASYSGHHDVVQSLLEAGADVNIARSDDGSSPLCIASFKGHLDIVKTLIEAGANINQANTANATPLLCASRKGHHYVVESLLAAGADVSIAIMPEVQGPLWIASFNQHLNVVKILLAGGANVNQADQNDSSPLLIASSKGHLDIVKTLIEAGANINQSNKNGWSPLHTASFRNNVAVVKTLIEEGANVDQITKDGKTALDIAVQKGYESIITELKMDQSKIFNILAQQLCTVRQQKRQSVQLLHAMKIQKEQQLHEMRQQKEQTEQQLYYMRLQKEQREQELCDMRRLLFDVRQHNKQTKQELHVLRLQKRDMKEQICVSEKTMQATEDEIAKMKQLNMTLASELKAFKTDGSIITQTANCIHYDVIDLSASTSSSDNEEGL